MRAGGPSGEVMIPDGGSGGTPPSIDGPVQFDSDDLKVPFIDDETSLQDGGEDTIWSSETNQVTEEIDAEGTSRMDKESSTGEKLRILPPPGNGQQIYEIDPTLRDFKYHLEYRYSLYRRIRSDIDEHKGGMDVFSRGYEKFGFVRSAEGITYREWAPGADSAALVGDFNNWDPNADHMSKVRMGTPSGTKDSIPAWIKYSVQTPGDIPYNGIYYDPPEEEKYVFKHPQPKRPKSLRIYETHVGMSSPEPKINTYANFRDEVLPRIKRLGYNAVQIMAIQEHSYYGSFGFHGIALSLNMFITNDSDGYHVTNFFAPSSRFGSPEDLKSLIDRAHELGLVVLMDVVHSHASNNTLDGLNGFDGTDTHYFHGGSRGHHWMWDSRVFNYGNKEVWDYRTSIAICHVIRFLLSNARWWLEEYKFDGFRFDGATSMMYTHHGLQVTFTGSYHEYFGFATDVDAVVYLMLVNDLIHGFYPEAVTIGEDWPESAVAACLASGGAAIVRLCGSGSEGVRAARSGQIWPRVASCGTVAVAGPWAEVRVWLLLARTGWCVRMPGQRPRVVEVGASPVASGGDSSQRVVHWGSGWRRSADCGAMVVVVVGGSEEHSLGVGVEAREAAPESAFVLHMVLSLVAWVAESSVRWVHDLRAGVVAGAAARENVLYVIGYRFWSLELQSGRLVSSGVRAVATTTLALVAFFKAPLFPPMGLVGKVKKVVEVMDAKGRKGAITETRSPITLLIYPTFVRGTASVHGSVAQHRENAHVLVECLHLPFLFKLVELVLTIAYIWLLPTNGLNFSKEMMKLGRWVILCTH
ncbi:unnamed protein product [Triticum turgidum subsp. durum]|uniref:Glycosyl hydrolase family 13 catalytic domain-containing protein n=1 Tax=Triticum turgidum subsp. durum TaxID=4567 RepID=A0A9R1R910_TRITD|nr:unnamed protein product [Triticum turgidum subsp. durum]